MQFGESKSSGHTIVLPPRSFPHPLARPSVQGLIDPAESARTWIGRNLALVAFLSAYFLTFVLGNLFYPFQFGTDLARASVPDFDPLRFQAIYTFKYWLLLALPFLVTPLVAFGMRAAFAPLAARIAKAFPGFRRTDYVIITALCYGFVFYAFWQADALDLAWRGDNPAESLNARFELLDQLGYWPQMVLKSLLTFLAVYSFVAALRTRTRFWIGMAVFNLVAMSVLLLFLNMKWPALIFYVAGFLSWFLYSREPQYGRAVLALMAVLLVYVVVALAVVRLVPSISALPKTTETVLVTALNRMAVGYPFYYQVFTEDGPVCGTILDRIARRPSACHPSNFIYQKLADDESTDARMTQPAPAHVTGYALQGWAGALVELLIVSIAIGLFVSLPYGPGVSAMLSTITIMGGITGYFFSQLPVEGPFIYDHGFVWWAILVIAYTGFRVLSGRWAEG